MKKKMKNKMKNNRFMFDVEATSLHGSGFAFGAVVINSEGVEIDRLSLMSLEGAAKAGEWVQSNVIPTLALMPSCKTDLELREAFTGFYLRHKDSCEIWGDCVFPVETNFLSAVVADNPEKLEWAMPYPLRDMATFIDVNIDRAETCGLEGLRPHNPLDDARASAKLLMNNL